MESDRTQLYQAFYGGTRGPNTPLVINDSVEVTSGLSAGLKGTAISLEEVEPERIYQLERDDGHGFHLEAWENLRLVEASALPCADAGQW